MAGNFTLDKPQFAEFLTKGGVKVTSFRATAGSEFAEKMEKYFRDNKIGQVFCMSQSESNGYITLTIAYQAWPDDIEFK